ncbi:protein serine/threonine phosphatase 2C family protein [Candidatus Gottesmanbacteria bacterium]|nr:protein serine/threonine phosphatase 2C family protein [Candidatus Gottesmanbacteria bacterium]
MRGVRDPRLRVFKLPKEAIIFAFAQWQGSRSRQEDFVGNFKDECFVVCDGVSGLPHGDVAANLAGETALWAYKQVRLRKGYWADKRLLIRRIFRSTNLTIWQKKREPGFEDGLATTLLVAIVGPMTIWVGSVGDSSAWVYNGNLLRLTREDRDRSGNLTRALGYQRLGLWPNASQQRFLSGDLLILATDGITSVLSPKEVSALVKNAGDTSDGLTNTAQEIIRKARNMGATDNMTVCLVKRIALP